MTGLDRRTTRHDDEIETTEVVLAKTETLTDESLDTVAIGGVADLLAGNGKTESWYLPAVGSSQDG